MGNDVGCHATITTSNTAPLPLPLPPSSLPSPFAPLKHAQSCSMVLFTMCNFQQVFITYCANVCSVVAAASDVSNEFLR